MFEASQANRIATDEERQPAVQEGTSMANQDDTTGELFNARTLDNGQSSEQAKAVPQSVQEVSPHGGAEATVNSSEAFNQHAEAGRKGAHRIHQLIQQGKLYEREHGLKPGRQRLRQLIEEGKLYEQEHGLRSVSKRARTGRRPRISHEQLFKNLLQSLLRLAKPTHRARILSLLQGLEAETQQGSAKA